MKYITKIVCKLLKNTKLSDEDKLMLSTTIMDKLGIIPFCDIIKTDDEGRMIINGRTLDVEGARILCESAKSALNSEALKFVREQIAFRAVNIGVHNGDTFEKIMFARSALWWWQEEIDLLKQLAQEI